VADEAKKQKMVLAGHVPDAIRASEAVSAGQKSIEHLTGVFELLHRGRPVPQGTQRALRFLQTYDPARCDALIASFATITPGKYPLWCGTGQWLVDVTDISRDPNLKLRRRPGKRIRPQFTKGILAEPGYRYSRGPPPLVKKELT